MTRDPIRITRPDVRWDDLAGLREVVESGWLTNGPKVRLFEDRLREYLGAEHVVAVSSGTSALMLALLASGVQPGDDVLIPDFTFPATANAVEHVGARPVLVDVELDTFNLDLLQAEEAVTPRTRAFLPVHQFGRPMDLDALAGLAARRRLILVEDAACALGAEHGGRRCGTLGMAGCFSFHPRKVITTGEGGAIATHDPAVADLCRQLRNHGMATDGAGDYRLCGYNFRMSDLHAAVGLPQLDRLEEHLQRRALLARLYTERLARVPGVRTSSAVTHGRHAHQSYVVLLEDSIDREACMGRLGEQGIEARAAARAIHTLPYYQRKYGFRDGDLPRSYRAARSALALPLYAAMAEEDVKRVVDSLRAAIAAR